MPYHRQRRQNDVPATPTTLSGISGIATIIPSATVGTALQTDSNGATLSITAPAIATKVPAVTVTPTTTSSPSTSEPPSTDEGAPKTSSISTGTAIAACVGAVLGVVLIVLIAWCFYRRYTRNLNTKAQAAPEKRGARARGSNGQSKKRSAESWNKREEVGDEDKISAKEIGSPIGMEHLTMFQKSPTVRSPMSENMTEESCTGIFDRPFARYHPSSDQKPSESPHLMDRAVTKNPPSVPWDPEKDRKDALLSLRPADFEKSAGNNISKAIPTPPAVENELHRWESAEVLHFDAYSTPEGEPKVDDKKDSISVGSDKHINPFLGEAEARKTVGNPFFNAQDFGSSDSGNASPAPLSLKAQGKQRAIDPFVDDSESPLMPVPPMPFTKHTPSSSTASYNSDRAIQSLVNALDVSEQEVQERLRITSLQPSFVSADSIYPEEADVTSAFPLPPP